MRLLLLFNLLILSIALSAQTFRVLPYLQEATPNSIYILWETVGGEESTVEWGLTAALGNSSTGINIVGENGSQRHQVQLTGLDRFTSYHYRVKTGSAVSDIYTFKTPPFASDQESFRLLAMSDMQRDGSQPDKYREIVEDGVIAYLNATTGGALRDELAMVLIPGDLVVNGNTFSQWEEHFFTPAQALLNQVPVYPVPGNHENDSDYFFQYFKLPENGSPGLLEHWWYHDYGNIRIIGLDSNGPYRTQEQLNWLSNVLALSCANEDIDFVFAQLHHPHLSELWLPGEIDFTGEVITRLEDFSTNCGKPSIHFFGHTHGYSRGQSRDHKHLWVNVATAGGAIDHWGDYPQADYDEFSVSRDEWGFVTVDVTDGEDPQFTLKRISRGNEAQFLDNAQVDSLTVRKNSRLVDVPVPVFPLNESVSPECVILQADAFGSEAAEALHGQSHWQIVANCKDFSDPLIERWKNYENLYFYEDTQAGDDLTNERITDLMPNTEYCWRVRYRDRELNWSEWSAPTAFSTTASSFSANLLINSGAENQLQNWTVEEGIAEALTDGECNGISPHSGTYYFAVGGLCEESAFAICYQEVNVVAFADSIDSGNWQASFGGYLSNYSGSDLPALYLRFFNESGALLDSSAIRSSLSSNWTAINELADIPAQTRLIQMVLTGTRIAGLDNDSYFDDLFLRLGNGTTACSEYVTRLHNTSKAIPTLQIQPNPWSQQTTIVLPEHTRSDVQLILYNMLGQTIVANTVHNGDSLTLTRGQLQAGVYLFQLRQGNSVIGKGRFVVE